MFEGYLLYRCQHNVPSSLGVSRNSPGHCIHCNPLLGSPGSHHIKVNHANIFLNIYAACVS